MIFRQFGKEDSYIHDVNFEAEFIKRIMNYESFAVLNDYNERIGFNDGARKDLSSWGLKHKEINNTEILKGLLEAAGDKLRRNRKKEARKKDALSVMNAFEQIKKRGGHAAIDFDSGQLLLMCTKPNLDDKSIWGCGAPPVPHPKAVRIVEC